MRETTAEALCDRIWSCVPVTGQAFSTLLSLLDVEISTAVPTACVTTGARSRMLVNPEFVAEHCRSDEHLSMLVLHELYHVVLGHTRLYPRVTPAQNWAFDCLINAQLCRLFPQPKYTSFFTQFVPGDGGPGDLLAPPRDWHPDYGPGPIARARKRATASGARLAEAHWRLYGDDSITTDELYRLLVRVGVGAGGSGESTDETFPDDSLAGMTLLGNHSRDAHDEPELHPEAMREVRELIARWPIVERRSGRDQGGEQREERVSPAERRRQAVGVLRSALLRVAGPDGVSAARQPAVASVDALLPYDNGRDRRAAVQRALGHEPLLFGGEFVRPVLVPVDRVRVYLDVSGSMETVLALLYAALAGCLDLVEPTIYGFSTAIGPLTHAQLRRGLRLTTGGTDIEAVSAHLLANPARRVLIVTDGWVGRIPADHLRTMLKRRVRLAAVVVAVGDPGFAADAGYPVFRLPELASTSPATSSPAKPPTTRFGLTTSTPTE